VKKSGALARALSFKRLPQEKTWLIGALRGCQEKGPLRTAFFLTYLGRIQIGVEFLMKLSEEQLLVLDGR
jgi:hypothetical protein